MSYKKSVPSLRFKQFKNLWERKVFGSGVEPYIERVDSSTDLPVYSSSRAGLLAQESYFSNRRVTNEGEYGIVPYGYFVYRHMSDDLTFMFNINNVSPKIAVSKEYPVFCVRDWDARFIRYKLNYSNDFKKFAATQKLGGTRTRLYFKKLCLWETSIPNIREQQKIADFLSAVDEKITLLKEKYALLQQYKKGVVQKLFNQENRFKDDDGQAFPDWIELPFAECFERVTRKNKIDNRNVLTISAQHGLINQEKYFNKSVAAANVTGYYLLNKGEFAYNKSYSKGYPMGAIKRLNNYDLGVVSTLYICFKSKHDQIDEFWEQFFEGGMLNRQISKIAQEGARNHGLLNISVTEFFQDIKVMVPSIEEQRKIAEFLQALDKKLDAVQQQIDLTQTFKKGLLQQMLV